MTDGIVRLLARARAKLDSLEKSQATMPPTPWVNDEFRAGDWWVKHQQLDKNGAEDGCYWVLQHLDKREGDWAVAIGNALPMLIAALRGELDAAEKMLLKCREGIEALGIKRLAEETENGYMSRCAVNLDHSVYAAKYRLTVLAIQRIAAALGVAP